MKNILYLSLSALLACIILPSCSSSSIINKKQMIEGVSDNLKWEEKDYLFNLPCIKNLSKAAQESIGSQISNGDANSLRSVVKNLLEETDIDLEQLDEKIEEDRWPL